MSSVMWSVCIRRLLSSSRFPSGPTWSVTKIFGKHIEGDRLFVSEETLEHVETLSLLKDPDKKLSDYEEKTRLENLKFFVHFVEQLKEVETEDIEPLYSLCEDSALVLNEDMSRDTLPVVDVTRNSKRTENGYFVAPLPTWYQARKQSTS
ncbi:glutamyl-tRNA(Gln) amidotransferase subunit C, mitochondrial-like [Corticium candelabrum]|uniref:glutamyl-tRNA(Gln) amidotransferase subunit C, mitochondrial-like n=1 Tax=Corticium candelabrum TaxID=121492 RepID=UPI002E26154F|nr:glutamyl-tRNA(Gln) amidotransferase subunit C, mitochondrial-like [Corticium candelabrum]